MAVDESDDGDFNGCGLEGAEGGCKGAQDKAEALKFFHSSMLYQRIKRGGISQGR